MPGVDRTDIRPSQISQCTHAIRSRIKTTSLPLSLKPTLFPLPQQQIDGMTSSPLSLSLRPSPSNEAASAEQYFPLHPPPICFQPPTFYPAADLCVTRLTLAHVLARITTEYGPTFANVTEDKLQAQISSSQDQDVVMENASPTPETTKSISREELIKIVQ